MWKPFVKYVSTFSQAAKDHAGNASQEACSNGEVEQPSCWAPCLIRDLKTSGCSGFTGLKHWPAFHSWEFRTLQPTRWDSGLIYELEPSPEKSTGSRHRDWKSHPSQRLSHSLTTPYPPRDNCVLLWYRALKWSWQSSIYKVIWACRMESTTLAVFEFRPTEVPFTRSSCLCFSFFFFPSPPGQRSCS